MNFTDSPFEKMMKEVPRASRLSAKKHPNRTGKKDTAVLLKQNPQKPTLERESEQP